jgi:catechol 2,3-dioxygenase-like lactoylglutathione lyase family enzyme
MPIPPRVSVVALRTVDLARATAFYVALGWELSAASTAAMSLFKTAGSLLLVCTDELLTELGGQEVAAALAGQPTGEAVRVGELLARVRLLEHPTFAASASTATLQSQERVEGFPLGSEPQPRLGATRR